MAEETTTPIATPPAATPPAATPPAPDVAALAAKLEETIRQASLAQAALESANAEKTALAERARTLEAANATLMTDLTRVKTESSATSSRLDQLDAEKVNFEQQLVQLTGQLTDAASEIGKLSAAKSVFDTIASDPKLHPMVGHYASLQGIIRPDASAEEIKTALSSMAGMNTAAAQALSQDFNKGTLPPVGGGSPPSGGDPNRATSLAEAHAKYQQVVSQKGTEAEAAKRHWLNEAARFQAEAATRKPMAQ